MLIYVGTAIVMQAIGFGLSQIVDRAWPTAGLMTFLILFMGAYGLAWPVAVRITEWAIRRLGYTVETEDPRTDYLNVPRPRRAS